LGQQVQARIACAEVIDRRLESHGPIGAQDVQHMLDVQLLVFGELEDQAIERKARPHGGRQCQANTGARFVDRVRHEVDGEMGVCFREIQRGGQLDRFDPALLVEHIAVLIRNR